MFHNLCIEKSAQFRPSRKQQKLLPLCLILLSLVLVVFLPGCANHKVKTQELLNEDYHTLSNDNLTLYFYKLEDQIEVIERKQTGSSISLGLGLGSFGHRSGGSGSVGVTTGGSQRKIATDLRNRRNEVKLELQHRGIIP